MVAARGTNTRSHARPGGVQAGARSILAARRGSTPIETFTEAERAALEPHFTNLDRPVFALVNLPETVKGALFARYSRYQGTLRRLYLDEFAADAEAGAASGLRRRGGRAGPQALRAHLPRLRRRLGGPARRRAHRVRVRVERDDQAAPARPPGRLPRAVHALHPLRRRDARRRLPLLARRLARPRVRRGDGLPLRHLLGRAAARGGVGGGAVPARRRRARGRARALDPGEGAGPAARPAAGGLALPHGHLRQRPGLRAAAAAPVRLAAARGARVRPHDPHRAEGHDAQLRHARGPPRPRRRVDLTTWRSARRRPSAGPAAWASAARTPRRTPGRRCGSCPPRARRTTCWPRCCSRRPRRPRTRRAPRCGRCPPTSARRCSPSWWASGATAATARVAASRRCATASRWCPTTARSATSSATACSPSSGRRCRPTSAPACRTSWTRPGWATTTARPWSARPPSTRGSRDAGLPELAPYALCLGYRIRYVLDMNAREAMHLVELRSGREGHPGYRAVAHEIHAQIAAVHPAVAAAMTYVDVGHRAPAGADPERDPHPGASGIAAAARRSACLRRGRAAAPAAPPRARAACAQRPPRCRRRRCTARPPLARRCG